MKKSYYAITKTTQEGFEAYLTIKNIKGNSLPMFTGNKNFAYTFESEKEAKNFYETYPWTEVPQINIITL